MWIGSILPVCVLSAALAEAWWLAIALALGSAAGPWLVHVVSVRRAASANGGAEDALVRAQAAGDDAVCIWLRLLDRATGDAPTDAIMAARLARLAQVLRPADHLERRDRSDILVVLAPGPVPDLEDMVQLAARLQGAAIAADPERADMTGDDTEHGAKRLTATIGLCRSADLTSSVADHGRTGAIATQADRPVPPVAILDAAAAALADALAEGMGTIRVYAPGIQTRQSRRTALAADAERALSNGGFAAWFQPQVCTDTGRISGFEALARWNHPAHGLVSPGDFLPVLEAGGLLERLGSVMLDLSLKALSDWDKAGFDVPSVGVNMSEADLRDPHLTQRIAWMLDRHDLHGNRLTIEVLESVVAEGGAATTDSPVLRNVAALADMGCRIDLDDFGTGHASITSLHRLPVSRVKIDRSFVVGVDQDRDRQKMMMTILSMCDHLGLETLAEGVETRAEHAMLAQLGCNHVQGFGIGHPMPFDACCDWLRARNVALDAALRTVHRNP
jgi:EAL domain-containing protein (putative c-di-GMP-specific phosphodiesterase class I)